MLAQKILQALCKTQTAFHHFSCLIFSHDPLIALGCFILRSLIIISTHYNWWFVLLILDYIKADFRWQCLVHWILLQWLIQINSYSSVQSRTAVKFCGMKRNRETVSFFGICSLIFKLTDHDLNSDCTLSRYHRWHQSTRIMQQSLLSVDLCYWEQYMNRQTKSASRFIGTTQKVLQHSEQQMYIFITIDVEGGKMTSLSQACSQHGCHGNWCLCCLLPEAELGKEWMVYRQEAVICKMH